MLELNIKIKNAAICDKYFIVNGHDGECCDNLFKDTGLTCQQVYADRNYKNKRKKNPILKEYDKCYKRMYARYSSRKNLSSEKYNSWKEEAARERDKALRPTRPIRPTRLSRTLKNFLATNKKPPGTLICTGYFYMFHSVLSCVILTVLSNRNPATGGGEHMEIVISFLWLAL